jgi:CBS domain-containing protein
MIDMKIKEVMKPALTIEEGATALKAASLMEKHDVGSLIVIKNSAAVGIITERDLLSKVTAKNKTPSKVAVKDLMSKGVITLDPDSMLDDAAYLMIKHKIKRLPVVKDKKLLGIVTATDVVSHSDDLGQFYIFD